jgi:hypothetical protein
VRVTLACTVLELKACARTDFTHNITDGLVLSAAFYSSPTIGATTAVAVSLHKIPHEAGDFALLTQSGFTKQALIGAQFVTALKALLGTVIGITVHEFAISSHGALGRTNVLTGTSLAWGPMLLPFTAGTFFYVRMIDVIPELLEPGPARNVQLKKTAQRFMAVAAGQGIMLSRRPLLSSGTTLLMCNPVLPVVDAGLNDIFPYWARLHGHTYLASGYRALMSNAMSLAVAGQRSVFIVLSLI